MKVDVIATVDEVKVEDIKNKTVIVLDILRATSTIVTALAHKAKRVIPVETIGQARQYREEDQLLAGERYCKRVAGFPFTNSPTEMSSSQIEGKTIVLTTTNGTRAIQKSIKAARVLIGSFLNGPTVARLAIELRRDITILCAGSRQKFALEDGLCAGYLLNEMTQLVSDLCIDDFGESMLAAFKYYEDQLPAVMHTTATGKRLVAVGSVDDIVFCSQKDVYSFVPVLKENAILIDFPIH